MYQNCFFQFLDVEIECYIENLRQKDINNLYFLLLPEEWFLFLTIHSMTKH